MNSYLIGTAPFCSPDSQQCYATPGYKPGRWEKDGCWTGSKMRCYWDENLWKKSGLYDQLRRDGMVPGRRPMYRWFGNSPLCIVSNCDVFRENNVPVAYDMCGDGSCCVTSEKILGMQPVTNVQRQVLKEGREACGFK